MDAKHFWIPTQAQSQIIDAWANLYGQVIVVRGVDAIVQIVRSSNNDVLGWPVEQLVSRSSFELVHPNDRHFAREAYEAFSQGPGVMVMGHLRVSDARGAWHRMQCCCMCLDDSSSNPISICTLREGPLSAPKIVAPDQPLGLDYPLLNALSQGIFAVDPSGIIKFCNPAAAALTGWSEEDLIGLPIARLLPECPIPNALVLEPLRYPEATHSGETTLHYIDASIIDVRYTWVFNTLTTDPPCMLLVLEDLRDRQLIQASQAAVAQALQTENKRLEFIAAITHDLRTPLHHIKGYASTLRQHYIKFPRSTVDEYLSIIQDECDALVRLVTDLQNLSELEMGHLRLSFDSVQVDELLKRTVQRWQSTADHRFELRLPDSIPPIPADPTRVLQVLDNLLGNIVTHTPANTTATLELRVTRHEFVVSITDDGPGIDSEHLPHLFDRFYQASQTKGTVGARGLGLYICRGIISAHGGRIWVESSPGAGTTFHFTLPRRRVRSAAGG